jgi:6-phosphogluconate dehydrogenase
MGTSLAGRASERGHRVVGWDPDGEARERATQVADVAVVAQLEELVEQLEPPRFVLLYGPHGDPVDTNLDSLGPLLDPADVVADAGNSHWEDSRRRHEQAEEAGFRFLDVGTSGGTSEAFGWDGAAFMVGGPRDAFDLVAPVLRDLAVDDAAVHHVGEQPGIGHFVKLVHNAIEFGMLEPSPRASSSSNAPDAARTRPRCSSTGTTARRSAAGSSS